MSACELGPDHVGECGDCGLTLELGWAHLCRSCWDALLDDPPCVECDGFGVVRSVSCYEGAVVAELGPARPCSSCEREPS